MAKARTDGASEEAPAPPDKAAAPQDKGAGPEKPGGPGKGDGKPADEGGSAKQEAPAKPAKEKVKRTFVDAETGKVIDESTIETTNPDEVAKTVKVHAAAGGTGNPGFRRPVAIVLWLVGILFEVLALLVYNGTLSGSGSVTLLGNPTVWLVGFIVVDLAAVLVGSAFWRQANHMDPPSEANKAEFFVKSQLGAMLAVLAFLPLLLVVLFSKNSNKQMKTVGTIAAIVALAIGVGGSIDYHPVSSEDLQRMEQDAIELGDGYVYWSQYGSVYHLNKDCSHIVNSANITRGSAKQAYEANRTRPCKDCADASGSEVLKKLSSASGTSSAKSSTSTQDATAGSSSAQGAGEGQGS